MKRNWSQPVLNFYRPELPFAAGVICGCASGEFLLLPLILLAAAGCLLADRRAGILFICGAAAGTLAFALHLYALDRDEQQLPAGRTNAVLLCRCTDQRITRIEDMPELSSFFAEILSINGRKCPSPVSIQVMRRNKMSLPGYGEIFSGNGPLLPVDCGTSYGKRLARHSILRIWEPEEIRITAPASGIIHRICRIRDRLLERVTKDFVSERAKIITAAMFFGCTGGFDREMRGNYINSGTIHLFSISGMHLTAVAVLLISVLHILPLRLRYVLLVLITAVYALSTGANPPVMRAWLVILLTAAGKFFFIAKNLFDLLCLAAAAFFLLRPELVFDTGTQYSFFITAILLLAMTRMEQISQDDRFCVRCIPGDPAAAKLQKAAERRWKLLYTCGISIAVFAAGLGISAVNQNIITPGAVFANLLLAPLVPLLFALAGIKLLAGPLLPAEIVERTVLLLDGFCTECSRIFAVLAPGKVYIPEAVLFCAALLFFIGAPQKRLRQSAAILISGLLLCWLIRPHFMKPAAAVISSDPHRDPVIVIAEPQNGTGFLINASGSAEAELAADFLLDRGIREPESLLFTGTKTANIRGINTVFAQIPPVRVRLPDKKNPFFISKLMEYGIKNPASGGREREFAEIFKEKTSGRLEYFNPGSNLSFCIKWSDTPQGRRISVNGKEKLIVWSNTPEVVIYGFQ